MKPIAHIRTDLPQKFGIPRNSFLAPHLQGRIVFEPEFALNSAVAGLDGFFGNLRTARQAEPRKTLQQMPPPMTKAARTRNGRPR